MQAFATPPLARPVAGSHGGEESESAFLMSTASWYFLDEVEMTAPSTTRVIVAFGDSITDGTASTLNGNDRWPDVFARRLHAVAGNRYSVVNEGIGGNEVVGPPDYAAKPTPGGPSALDRLQRDEISLPVSRPLSGSRASTISAHAARPRRRCPTACARVSSACARRFPACASTWRR
jgi:hypothetical protein